MKRTDTIWAGLIGLYTAIAASNPLTQNDLFWHLALGRSVLSTGSRTVEEPWALFGAANMRRAPEWLWEVLCFAIERVWGLWAIHILVFCCAALFGFALVWLMRTVADQFRTSIVALLPVGALGAAAVNSRFNERPETLALVLLTVALTVAQKFARADGAGAIRWGLFAIAIEVLYAQVHGTFVLVPVLMGFACLSRLATRDPRFVRACAITFVGLSLGALTSAYGIDFRGYLLSHVHGDAVRHIMDMNAPAWASVNPSERPYFGYYFALLGLGVVLSAARRRVGLNAALCALLGCLLFATAVRAVGLAALLALPLALEGASGLLAERTATRVQVVASVVAAVLIGLIDLTLNDGKGERLVEHIGFDFDRVPVASARFIRDRLGPSRVLASFAAAAPLAYLTDGKAKVLMDSRTPLHFDDTQYALLRDSLRSVSQLEKAAHWFDIAAVVVRQDQPDCGIVAQSTMFVPVIVEWGFTTFVRRDVKRAERGLKTLLSCAALGRINTDFCGRDFELEFERDLKQTGWSGDSFLGLLRAERTLRCGPRRENLSSLPTWLEAAKPESDLRDEQKLWLGLAFAQIGKHELALRLLLELALKGHLFAANAMVPSLSQVSAAQVRANLDAVAALYEDGLPVALRIALAHACMTLNDVPCVRFHGLRAFLGSRDEAIEIIRWLHTHDPEAVRSDFLTRALRIRTRPAE